jgi:hypothetical protein
MGGSFGGGKVAETIRFLTGKSSSATCRNGKKPTAAADGCQIHYSAAHLKRRAKDAVTL